MKAHVEGRMGSMGVLPPIAFRPDIEPQAYDEVCQEITSDFWLDQGRRVCIGFDGGMYLERHRMEVV